MKYAPPLGQEALGEDAHYTDGNPDLGILGSIVPAASIEQGQREIVNVIKGSGLEPSAEDLSQLLKAMIRLIGMNVPLATTEKAGMVQIGRGLAIGSGGCVEVKPGSGLGLDAENQLEVKPDPATLGINSQGALTALGGNLVCNEELWITESGTFIAPVAGWYNVWMIGGGQASNIDFGPENICKGRIQGGHSGKIFETLAFIEAGQSIPVTIGSGGVLGGVPRDGGETTFGSFTTANGFYFAPGSTSATTSATFGQIVVPGGGYGAYPTRHGHPNTHDRHNNDGHFWGAGGSVIFNAYYNANKDETVGDSILCGDGKQGAIRLRFWNPAKTATPMA